MSRTRAFRLVERLIEADAIDHAYVASIEHRIPETAERHPLESTAVGVEELFVRDDRPTSEPAERIKRLRNVLADVGIHAKSSGSAPLPMPRLGTVRLFRAETGRLDTSGAFEGWNRASTARGNYFSTSPVAAARYGEPVHAPRGAQLRYVDVPRAVADGCRITKPEVLDALRARSQRLPVSRSADELDDNEFYLDDEWSGRAMAVPAVVEAGDAVSSNNVFDSSEWWFGREVLVTDTNSTMPAQITVQYIGGPAVDNPGEPISKDWTGSTRSQHRHFANADVMIPMEGDSVLFVRAGVEAHSTELLLTILTGADTSKTKRIDFSAVEVALTGVEHLITGDSAAVLQGTMQGARHLDAVDVSVPRSALGELARVIAHSDAAPSNASSIGWSDEASVLRKLLSCRGSVPLRSPQLGSINVTVIDDETFAAMRQDIVSATLSAPGRDGSPERIALQMARSTPNVRKAGRRVRSQGIDRELHDI